MTFNGSCYSHIGKITICLQSKGFSHATKQDSSCFINKFLIQLMQQHRLRYQQQQQFIVIALKTLFLNYILFHKYTQRLTVRRLYFGTPVFTLFLC